MTPVALAAAVGQWEVVMDSSARNANLETKDISGRTLIALAAAFKQWEARRIWSLTLPTWRPRTILA
jgi:hypothetical protein